MRYFVVFFVFIVWFNIYIWYDKAFLSEWARDRESACTTEPAYACEKETFEKQQQHMGMCIQYDAYKFTDIRWIIRLNKSNRNQYKIPWMRVRSTQML